MPAVNVLIVDDNPIVRRILTEMISEDRSVTVVGTASNGREALNRIPDLNPDVLVLDIEMPVMDGLETMEVLRKNHPGIVVIIFSTHTERGAACTLKALSRGASDYVCKPSGGPEVVRQVVRSSLIPKVKAFVANEGSGGQPEPVPSRTRKTESRSFDCTPNRAAVDVPEMLLIGSSAGGPQALSQLMPVLDKTFLLPVLIVQHMPPMFTRLFAQRLDKVCALEVREAQEGDSVQPGRVLIAPGDYHMELVKLNGGYQVTLNQGPMENYCRPAVDPLFRSAAHLLGPRLIAVMLTGMGQDGSEGSRAVHEAGGRILVQDKESSMVWGMPGSVANAGLADEILPLDELPGAIMARCKLK